MTPPLSNPDDREYVRRQVRSLTEALTNVMFGDFTAVAHTSQPDEDFGNLCAMVNVAINAARNAHGELRRTNEELSAANERLHSTIAKQERAEQEIRRFGERLERLVDERTTELKEANAELEAFSYSVSHDLRAPLRAIDGFTRLLRDEFSDDLPPDARRYVGLVIRNTQDMGELIDGLLIFSRLGQQQIKQRSLDMTSLAREAVTDLGTELAGRTVAIEVRALPRARGDPMLVRQVLANLLSNAVKYTRNQRAARIDVSSYEADGTPVYVVRDNGVGFDMRYADKLFQVFQRLHRAEDYEGTGIGLALVDRIVTRHGGRIWAEAAPDEGAAFHFTLEATTA